MPTSNKASDKAVDPVCGMEIDPTEAPQTREAMGQTYYFCSNYCAEIFDPEMTESDLARLRAAIGGTGCWARPKPAVRARDLVIEAISKLMDLLFRR